MTNQYLTRAKNRDDCRQSTTRQENPEDVIHKSPPASSYRSMLVAFLFLALVAACKGQEPNDAKYPRASTASAPTISRADGEGLAMTLAAATFETVQDPADRARILMQGCREIPSCAGACRDALAKAGSPLTRRADVDGILAACFVDFKQEHEKRGLSREDWIEGFMAAYADRVLAANVLKGKDAKMLRESRAKLRAK